MDVLPDSLLLQILSYLPRQSLCLGVRMTCRRWRDLSHDCSLWRGVSIPNHFTDNRLLLLLNQIADFVEEMDISGANCLTETGLLKMATTLDMPNLKKIAVPISLLLPDEFYSRLAKSCPRLTEVENIRTSYSGHCNPLLCQSEFPNLTALHDRPVATFGRIRVNSSPIDISKRQKWTASLLETSQSCKLIKSYCCNRGLDYINGEGLEVISKTFPFLVSLELHSCAVTDEGLGRFFAFNQTTGGLKDINFDKPGPITDQGLSIIADNCPALTKIKIARCSRITNKGVQYLLDKCPNLSDLHINNSPGYFEDTSDAAFRKEDLNDSTIYTVAEKLDKLIFFRIFHTNEVTFKGIQNLTSGCAFLVGMMLFECSQICDEALRGLTGARFLKNVILVNCNVITPTGLTDFVVHAPSLNRMTFYTKNWEFCGDMTTLAEKIYTKIDMDTNNFRPNQIHKLALRGVGAGFLQLLTVLCPNLVNLDLRESKYISEHSLVSVLNNCECLEYLDISAMEKVGSDFLSAVCRFGANLRVLSLGKSVGKISAEALTDILRECMSLNTIEMEIILGQTEDVLMDLAKRYHGGKCYLYVENEEEETEMEDSVQNERYVELHFTPIKYLNSIKINE